MQGCNCLVDIPAGSGALRAGEPVNVWMLPVSPLLRGEQTKTTPIVCAISGVKNSGKTTLLTRLLPLLKEKGLRIACIKHDGHPFDPDVPGTDSHKVRSAGADAVAIYSEDLSMVIKKEQTDETALLRRFSDMDLVCWRALSGRTIRKSRWCGKAIPMRRYARQTPFWPSPQTKRTPPPSRRMWRCMR